jgi:hypothetical protein
MTSYRRDSKWDDEMELRCLVIFKKLQTEGFPTGRQMKLCQALSSSSGLSARTLSAKVSNFKSVAGINNAAHVSSNTVSMYKLYGKRSVAEIEQLADRARAADAPSGPLVCSVASSANSLDENGGVLAILSQAKVLAQRYRDLTGKPLGITGEVAEYEAARRLRVVLTPARQAGYDAMEERDGKIWRLQIKGRCVRPDCKPGQRVGAIDIQKEFDAVLLVLLDVNFEATAIYEAPRDAVIAALTKPGSKARNERGALSIAKFKDIGMLRWPPAQ